MTVQANSEGPAPNYPVIARGVSPVAIRSPPAPTRGGRCGLPRRFAPRNDRGDRWPVLLFGGGSLLNRSSILRIDRAGQCPAPTVFPFCLPLFLHKKYYANLFVLHETALLSIGTYCKIEQNAVRFGFWRIAAAIWWTAADQPSDGIVLNYPGSVRLRQANGCPPSRENA